MNKLLRTTTKAFIIHQLLRAPLVHAQSPPPFLLQGTQSLASLLVPETVSGDTDCASASAATSFLLRFVSIGNYTALPGAEDGVPQLTSMSFAVANEANAVETQCAFSLGGGPPLPPPPPTTTTTTTWRACADRRDSDGRHLFTVATGARFAVDEGRVAVNSTWFCHDEGGRLVAYTGVGDAVLDLTCTEGEVSGYHLRNCTSADVRLPVTLL